MKRVMFSMGRVALFALLLLITGQASVGAEGESNLVTATTVDETNSETFRAYIQLQEQLRATQLLIERQREAAEADAIKRSDALGGRLQTLENSLNLQRARELDAMQSSNRVMLIVAGSFAIVGVLAMVLMVFIQLRAVHRLAEISAALPPLRAFASGLPALGHIESQPIALGSPSEAGLRLVGSLDRLEKRIRDLELATRPSLKTPLTTQQPSQLHAQASNLESNNSGPGTTSSVGRVDVLINEGLALLDDDKPEAAAARFDQALGLDPRHTEALIKKGNALERLRKFTEAVECYDRALAIDDSLTIAYLCKGGLFNRMERYGEALQCYEKALQTQEHRVANNSTETLAV